LDTVEFINVSKDDALAYPQVVHRTYPSTVNSRMEDTIAPFVRKALEVNYVVLNIFNEKLGLPQGTLERLHSIGAHSGSEARCIRNPPPQIKEAAERPALGAHTDFGSLVGYSKYVTSVVLTIYRQSFLHNQLGGLQVMPPGYSEWSYVRVRTSLFPACGRRSSTDSPSLDMQFVISEMRCLFSAEAFCNPTSTALCTCLDLQTS